MKLTKKKALTIIKQSYKDYNTNSYVRCLCTFAPKPLLKDWKIYWNKINTENHVYVSSVFGLTNDYDVLSSLTRLVLLHHFIEDTYK